MLTLTNLKTKNMNSNTKKVAERLESNFGQNYTEAANALITLCFCALENGVPAEMVADVSMIWDALKEGR